MSAIRTSAIIAFTAALVVSVHAQGGGQGKGQGKGTVRAKCQADISKLCAGKMHDGSVRTCLESNKAKVAAECKKALESTGRGRR